MGQVSGKSDPNPPHVEFRCILVDYIKPRSTWINGGFSFGKVETNDLYPYPRPKPEDTNFIISRLSLIEYTQISFEISSTVIIFFITGI